jgi:hypothetical protein
LKKYPLKFFKTLKEGSPFTAEIISVLTREKNADRKKGGYKACYRV